MEILIFQLDNESLILLRNGRQCVSFRIRRTGRLTRITIRAERQSIIHIAGTAKGNAERPGARAAADGYIVRRLAAQADYHVLKSQLSR